MKSGISNIFTAILTTLLMLQSVPGSAQDRYDSRKRYPVKTFQIIEQGGEVGVQFDYFGEEQTREGAAGRTRFSNRTFQEYVEYWNRGYVYHPRFLDFSTRIKLGLAQQSIDREGDLDDEGSMSFNDEIIGYDFRLRFFKEHPVSATVFGHRERRPVFGLFTDRFMTESQTEGITVNWKNRYVPMDFTYSRNRFQEWGADSNTDSTSDVFEYHARHEIKHKIRTDFNYRFERFHQDFHAENPLIDIDRTTDFDTHDVNLLNTYYFGKDRKSNLTSIARYHKRANDTDIETWSWQERLQLQHTRNFRTYYLASFLRNEVNTFQTDTYRGEIGLDHRLFKSLESHLDVHARRVEFDGNREDLYGVTGRLDYRKNTAAGVLSAGYARTLDWIDREGLNGNQQVLNEPLILQFGVINFLNNPDVVRTSIVVTLPDNATILTEGFDYEIIEVGELTGLQALPGGRLAGGDAVLVDYEFRIESGFSYLSDDQQFRIRHDFTKGIPGLAVYYRWHDLNPRGLEGMNEDTILEFTDQVIGYNYRWKFLNWTQEYQRYDSNFTEFDEIRSSLSGTHRLSRAIRLGWNAGFNYTQYEEDLPNNGDEGKFYFAGTNVTGRLGRRGFWSLEGRAQKEEGRVDRTILGVLAKAGIRYRKIRVEAGARFEQHDVFDNQRDRVHVFVQVARIFGRER